MTIGHTPGGYCCGASTLAVRVSRNRPPRGSRPSGGRDAGAMPVHRAWFPPSRAGSARGGRTAQRARCRTPQPWKRRAAPPDAFLSTLHRHERRSMRWPLQFGQPYLHEGRADDRFLLHGPWGASTVCGRRPRLPRWSHRCCWGRPAVVSWPCFPEGAGGGRRCCAAGGLRDAAARVVTVRADGHEAETGCLSGQPVSTPTGLAYSFLVWPGHAAGIRLAPPGARCRSDRPTRQAATAAAASGELVTHWASEQTRARMRGIRLAVSAAG